MMKTKHKKLPPGKRGMISKEILDSQEKRQETKTEERGKSKGTHKTLEEDEDKEFEAPKQGMEDRLKEGCKIPRVGMEDRQKGNIVTASKEDTSRLSEDGEVGQAKAEGKVINLSFQILFNEHKHMLTGDEQRIVLGDNKGMLREKTPKESHGSMKKDGEEEVDKENSTQEIATGPKETMRNRKQDDNQEARDKLFEKGKRMKAAVIEKVKTPKIKRKRSVEVMQGRKVTEKDKGEFEDSGQQIQSTNWLEEETRDEEQREL